MHLTLFWTLFCTFAAIPVLETKILKLALDKLSEKTRISADAFKVSSILEEVDVTHLYFKHVINGLEVAEHDGSVSITPTGKVIALTSNFDDSSFTPEDLKTVKPDTITMQEAFKIAETVHKGAPPIPETAEYVYAKDYVDYFIKGYRFQIRNDNAKPPIWGEMLIDAARKGLSIPIVSIMDSIGLMQLNCQTKA